MNQVYIYNNCQRFWDIENLDLFRLMKKKGKFVSGDV